MQKFLSFAQSHFSSLAFVSCVFRVLVMKSLHIYQCLAIFFLYFVTVYRVRSSFRSLNHIKLTVLLVHLLDCPFSSVWSGQFCQKSVGHRCVVSCRSMLSLLCYLSLCCFLFNTMLFKSQQLCSVVSNSNYV